MKTVDNSEDRAFLEELREQKKERKIIKPGKWSNINPTFSVVAKLKKNKSISDSYPAYLGKYITHDDGYKGDGYLALINVIVDDLQDLIKKNGLDNVLGAIEKSLNSYKTKTGKKVLGDLVILEPLETKENRIGCRIKTSRKFIPKFMGMITENGKGVLKVFS